MNPPSFQSSRTASAGRRTFWDIAWSSDEEDRGISNAVAADLGVDPKTFLTANWQHGALAFVDGRLAFVYPSGVRRAGDGKWLEGSPAGPWRIRRASFRPSGRIYLTRSEADTLRLLDAGIEDDDSITCTALPDGAFPAAWAHLFRGRDVVLCFEASCSETRRIERLIRFHALSVTVLPSEGKLRRVTMEEIHAGRERQRQFLAWLKGEISQPPEASADTSQGGFSLDQIREVTTKLAPTPETLLGKVRREVLEGLEKQVTQGDFKRCFDALPEESRARLLRQFEPRPLRRTVKIKIGKTRKQ